MYHLAHLYSSGSQGGSVPNEFGEIMDAINLLTFGSQKVINLYLFVLCRVKDVKNDKNK